MALVMANEARGSHNLPSLQVANDTTEAKRTKAFRKAARHTFMVRAYRVLLPLATLGSLAFYFASSEITVEVNGNKASVGAIEVSSDKLKMVNPRLEGFSEKNGAYVITADAAYQKIASPDIIELETVRATVKNSERGNAQLNANSGVFYSEKEFLTLSGNIRITSDTGMSADLEEAEVNMKAETIVSKKPVAIEMKESTITAATMLIHTDTRQIDFDGNVIMRLTPQGTTHASNQNAANPSAISLDPNAPIDITARKLTVYDDNNTAAFSGDILATQGPYRMTSTAMNVTYNGDGVAQTQNTSTSTDLKQIVATGKVEITADNGRRAQSNSMTFDAEAETVLMAGNVVLTQGRNVLKGNEFFADLKSGRSAFRPGGRVEAYFVNETIQPGSSARTLRNSRDANQIDLTRARGKPISVKANTLALDDTSKTATFSGKVVAVQGGYKINADALQVFYKGSPTGVAASNRAANLTKIKASRNVQITTPDNQSARADWAVYDVVNEKITIGPTVSMARGTDIIKGGSLSIDVKTGRIQLERNPANSNKTRVRGKFIPGRNKKKN